MRNWLAFIFASGLSFGACSQQNGPDQAGDFAIMLRVPGDTMDVVNSAYIRGVLQGLTIGSFMVLAGEGAKSTTYFCPPPGMKVGEYKTLFLGYIDANPDLRKAQTAAVMAMAVSKAFPCPP